MLRLLQNNMTTILGPFVDHVDQLFKAVESLGSELADQQARSKEQHEEMSLRLCVVANSVEAQQQDCETLVHAQLDKWLAEVLEPWLQKQNEWQTDRLRNLDGQMQALRTGILQPSLKQHEEMIREQLDSFGSRLSASEARAKTTASSLQEHKLLIGALQSEIAAACAQTEAKLGDYLDSALKKVHEERRLEISGLDERFSGAAAAAAAAETVICLGHVREEFQQVVDTMQQHFSGSKVN